MCSISTLQKFLILLTSFNIVFSNESLSQKDEIPVFKCVRQGDVCTFTNVNLNLTHFLWEPTADNPLLVGTVKFTTSKIPIITKNLCEAFPALNNLQLNGLGIQKIAEDAFHGCSLLTVLDLATNQITHIEPTTFLYTKKLEELLLSDNFIEELDDYKLFASLENLTLLNLNQNNLTDFSPELLRNNNKIATLRLYSNFLSDLHAEQLLEFLPDLKTFYWDENEASCMRVVEINRMLIARGINFNTPTNHKVRYYPQNNIFGNLKCNPDISWMASNYRKENSKLGKRMEKINGKMLKMDSIDEKLTKMDQRMNKMEEGISKFSHLLTSMEQKLLKIDKMEVVMQNLMVLVQQLKYQK